MSCENSKLLLTMFLDCHSFVFGRNMDLLAFLIPLHSPNSQPYFILLVNISTSNSCNKV